MIVFKVKSDNYGCKIDYIDLSQYSSKCWGRRKSSLPDTENSLRVAAHEDELHRGVGVGVLYRARYSQALVHKKLVSTAGTKNLLDYVSLIQM